MNEKIDFKSRIIGLISEGRSNEDIILSVKKEYKIYLTNEQIDRRRQKKSVVSSSEKEINLSKLILKAFSDKSQALSAKQISFFINRNFNNIKTSSRLINQIIYRELSDKLDYNKIIYKYSLKEFSFKEEEFNVIDVFQINRSVNLLEMTKSFIVRDSTFLNSGFKSIDKLINSFLYKDEISELDSEFLDCKLQEFGLNKSLFQKKNSIRLREFHKIEDLIHIIYEDHIIMDYELQYIKNQLDLNDIPDGIGNRRFWQISLFYYFDDLRKLDGFTQLIKLVYVLIHIDFERVKDIILSFDFINIYKSNSLQAIVNSGNLILVNKLKEILSDKEMRLSNLNKIVDSLVMEINDLSAKSFKNDIDNLRFEIVEKTRFRGELLEERKTKEVEQENPEKDLSLILSELSDSERNTIVNYIETGNRLSAFFKYSNCVAGNQKKNEIERNFEVIWDSFS
jgi:hypothetical protein